MGAHTHNSLNVHKSNMLELLLYMQTYTYTTHNSEKKLHTKIKARRKLRKTAKMHTTCIVCHCLHLLGVESVYKTVRFRFV